MAKIINFKGSTNVGKQVMDEIVSTLQTLDPEKVTSVLVSIGLESEDGRGTFLLVRGLDFYDIGYLESQLALIKMDLLDSHVVGTDVKEQDSFLDQFSKDEEKDE